MENGGGAGDEEVNEMIRRLAKYGVKGIVEGDHVIVTKKRPTFEFEMVLKDSGNEDDVLVVSISVEIRRKGVEFRYTMRDGNENVYLRYQKGEIMGHSRGIVRNVYLPFDIADAILTSSRALYGFVRTRSSFGYLLPKEYPA